MAYSGFNGDALDNYLTQTPEEYFGYTEDYEPDPVFEFVVENQDRLHYGTVAAIAADLDYDLDILLEAVRNNG